MDVLFKKENSTDKWCILIIEKSDKQNKKIIKLTHIPTNQKYEPKCSVVAFQNSMTIFEKVYMYCFKT